jgi:hypothetical protein
MAFAAQWLRRRTIRFGDVIAQHTSVRRVELMIGRSLAAGMHPYAAWRSARCSGRLRLVLGYLAAGYIAVLAIMLLS